MDLETAKNIALNAGWARSPDGTWVGKNILGGVFDADICNLAERAASTNRPRRDQAAELLSLVRSAYIYGFQSAVGAPAPHNSEMLYVRAEAAAIEYMRHREENERHPLAILVAQLSAK